MTVALTTAQEQDFSKVQITVTKVAGSVYMLQGEGGNIGASVGEDGIVVVDDQYAPLADEPEEKRVWRSFESDVEAVRPLVNQLIEAGQLTLALGAPTSIQLFVQAAVLVLATGLHYIRRTSGDGP